MVMLIDGQWHDRWFDTKKSRGRFIRSASQFRNWVTVDGSAGPSGSAGFKAEADRYHLYVSLACPWAHRTLIFRELKDLRSILSVSVVHWFMGEQGWSFHSGEGVVSDYINDAEYLHQIYTKANPSYSGRVTVPVLWDRKEQTIVSNESSEIIRMFNSAFDPVGAKAGDYYPAHLQSEIDDVNERIYHTLNNGVYRCGFATTQTAYEEAVVPLFETLDWLEQRLSINRYLMGKTLTEADWRLLTTLLRFDPVYYSHFKCNLRRLVDYPNLWAYTRDLYQMPGVASTFNLDHIKNHYYQSHPGVNPNRIVPIGPMLDYGAPHDRALLSEQYSIAG